MADTKRIPKFTLTEQQRKIVEEVRQRVEAEKPEILAESRRRTAADAVTAVQLRGAMSLLKAVRKTQGITLDEVARRTGIAKPTLSRLENDAEANVTINTLQRIAEALGHGVQVSVIPLNLPATPQSEPKATKPKLAKSQQMSVAELVGKMRVD